MSPEEGEVGLPPRPTKQRKEGDRSGQNSLSSLRPFQLSSSSTSPASHLEDISSSEEEEILENMSNEYKPEDLANMMTHQLIGMIVKLQQTRKKDMADLHVEIAELKQTISNSQSNAGFTPQSFIQFMRSYDAEKAAHERKRNNFVVYGLPEKSKDLAVQQAEDWKFAEIVVGKSGSEDLSVITEVQRMGKGKDRDGNPSKFPRLLKIKLNSSDVKKAVMKNQKDIIAEIPEMTQHREKYSQYFRHDLTELERNEHAENVRRRNAWNERDGFGPKDPKRWKVFNDRVVQFQGNGDTHK